MLDKIWELIDSRRNEFDFIPQEGWLLEEIEHMLSQNGLSYCDCSDFFDGGPGYDATHYVVSFVDECGDLQMVDWVEESM